MREKQISSVALPTHGAPSMCSFTWDSIDWIAAEQYTKRLQMRIAKAFRERHYGKAKALQWLLTHSFYGKTLAVKRVTENKGAKTPGIDGITWTTHNQQREAVLSLRRNGYKTQPLRRIYIPKKNGKQRPLGIPRMLCRAQQALHLLALEPISECLADHNAYGFRPKRSAADAIERCFKALAQKSSAQWILEGDIRACFDKIDHAWLIANVPMDKTILQKWLKAGYMERGSLYPTTEGTPQGGVISACLLVITLSGLERAAKQAVGCRDKVNVGVYADDFIITGISKEILEDKVKPAVSAFLKERGLELSQEKTKISHIEEGFDFLGFNVRKYKDKLLIKPSKSNIKCFLRNIRETINFNKSAKTLNLIRLLNPKIRGWANYFRHVVAKQTFSYVDHCIFFNLLKWARRRHPKKNSGWLRKKYFRRKGLNNGVFYASYVKDEKTRFLDLVSAVSTPIVRHIKIQGAAIPYDPNYRAYFFERKIRQNWQRKTHGKNDYSRTSVQHE